MTEIRDARLATLIALTERRPNLGRTALMKMCYFLQTLHNVPLRYRFTLYSYGPFDSTVLSDLASAEALGALRSEVVLYPGGYGYEIRVSDNAESLTTVAEEFLDLYKLDIDWVVRHFGGFGSADLELLSTIVYVSREFETAGKQVSVQDLIQRVREVKPRFGDSDVRSRIAALQAMALLSSVGSA